MPDDSVFGDDTNATPLTKLNIPQVSSNKGQAPLEPPVYSPHVQQPTQQQPPMQQLQPQPPMQHEPPPPSTLPYPTQHMTQPNMPSTGMMMAPHPPMPHQKRVRFDLPDEDMHYPTLPHIPKSRPSKLSRLMEYAHRAIVFVVVTLVLYWYRGFAQLPYMGDGNRLNVFGILVVALLGSSLYGIGEYMVD